MKASRFPIRPKAELQSAEYMTTRELATILHVTPWALMRWRRDGDGPSFETDGRGGAIGMLIPVRGDTKEGRRPMVAPPSIQ